MKVFDKYAQYYDLVNEQKDYKSESQYIASLIKKSHPNAKTLLDLGCGSGRHLEAFTQLGFDCKGVERSAVMLSLASKRLNSNTQTFEADVRTFKIPHKFDVAVSLFHVVSYQTKNEDLVAMFETVAKHLNPGGLFLFDVWYGPGVLSDGPTVREKRFENESLKVVRKSHPEQDFNKNTINVIFDITVEDKESKAIENIREEHLMRYLFEPELEGFLNKTGFELTNTYDWLKTTPPTKDSWYACFAAVKK